MKKLKYGLFLLLLLIPIFVKAETCELDKVNIKAITIKNQSETAEEIEKANFNQNKINLNVKFQEEGDYITYNIFIQNNSLEDFEFSTDKLNINSDYIEYTIETIDPIVKANQGKIIELKVNYKKAVEEEKFENGQFLDNKEISLKLLSEEEITNPETGTSHTIFSLLCIVAGCMIIWKSIKEDKSTKKATSFMIGMMLLIPTSVLAACQYNLDINSTVTIEQESKKICIITGTGNCGSRVHGDYINKREITKEEFDRFLENTYDGNYPSNVFDFIKNEDIENDDEYHGNGLSYSIPINEIHYSDEGCYIFSLPGKC